MSNKLIHEYFGIDYEILWKTIKHIIPEIKPLLKVAGWVEEQKHNILQGKE